MYNNNYQYQTPYDDNFRNQDDRIIAGGGFAAPFLLGGLTGALLAPYAYNRPYYQPYPVYYPYYPPYPYRRRGRYYY
ncbi:MAG: hypothetical protein WDA12_02445 [Bacilli bacterium]